MNYSLEVADACECPVCCVDCSEFSYSNYGMCEDCYMKQYYKDEYDHKKGQEEFLKHIQEQEEMEELEKEEEDALKFFLDKYFTKTKFFNQNYGVYYVKKLYQRISADSIYYTTEDFIKLLDRCGYKSNKWEELKLTPKKKLISTMIDNKFKV